MFELVLMIIWIKLYQSYLIGTIIISHALNNDQLNLFWSELYLIDNNYYPIYFKVFTFNEWDILY